jgi:hypothetical protein
MAQKFNTRQNYPIDSRSPDSVFFLILGPRTVSSFIAHASLLVRTNLKTCLVGFVNTTKKPLYNFMNITSIELIRTKAVSILTGRDTDFRK